MRRWYVYMYSLHATHVQRAIAVYVIDTGSTEASRSQIRPHFRDLFRLHAFFVSFSRTRFDIYSPCTLGTEMKIPSDYNHT